MAEQKSVRSTGAAVASTGGKHKTSARLGFCRSQRLKGRTTVDRVYRQGRRRMAHPLAARVLRREDQGLSRLGMSIGRKCGNAVQRNLIKRRLREAYRALQQELPHGTDFLILVRPHAALPLNRYKELLRQLLR